MLNIRAFGCRMLRMSFFKRGNDTTDEPDPDDDGWERKGYLGVRVYTNPNPPDDDDDE